MQIGSSNIQLMVDICPVVMEHLMCSRHLALQSADLYIIFEVGLILFD